MLILRWVKMLQMSMVVMFMTVVVQDSAQGLVIELISVVMILILAFLLLMSVVLMHESAGFMLKPLMVMPMPTVVMIIMLPSDFGGVYDVHNVNNDACGAGDACVDVDVGAVVLMFVMVK